MTPTLQTRRLILHPLALEDAAQVQPLFGQWEVVRHLNAVVPWPFPPDGALTYYRDNALPAIARGDECHWTLRLKSAPETIIGSIGLILNSPNNRGFWLAPEHQNRGLMTEALHPVNDFWFDTLQQPLLRVPKSIHNRASSRISEKTGMTLVAIEPDHHFVSGPAPAEIWQQTAAEWRAHKLRMNL